MPDQAAALAASFYPDERDRDHVVKPVEPRSTDRFTRLFLDFKEKQKMFKRAAKTIQPARQESLILQI